MPIKPYSNYIHINFKVLVGCYIKYQNSFIEHDEAIIEEVELTLEISSSFMKYLIEIYHQSKKN